MTKGNPWGDQYVWYAIMPIYRLNDKGQKVKTAEYSAQEVIYTSGPK